MKQRYTYFVILFLIVASCAAFGRIAGNDFINFDDNIYIIDNSHIKSGINPESIAWAFTSAPTKNWHPLTWLSHMLDWSVFGANPSGHHIVSLLLHIGAAIFLFLFLNKTTSAVWPSAFAAAFFALHPLRVESVAWAAERKDVLSMFFGMASLYAYALYAQSSKRSRYAVCLVLFALSLLSKSMMVTLPFVFLLLDYWPLGRFPDQAAPAVNRLIIFRLIREKIPFISLAILSSIVTVWAQLDKHEIQLPLSGRLFNAIISYLTYLRQTFWPFDLAVYYPFEHYLIVEQILIACVILIGITAAVIYAFKKAPYLFVGWFWYLGTLIPVTGLVQINAPLADRYTYLPSIGIAVMMAWGIAHLSRHDFSKNVLLPAGVTFIAFLAFLTWQQCGYWRDSVTVFSHAIQVTKDNYLAHNNRGVAFDGLRQYQRAVDDYNEAIRLYPDYADAYINRGMAYAKLGLHQLAFEDFNKAQSMKPDFVQIYCDRGDTYASMGRYQPAIEEYDKAIRLKPNYADAYNNRGGAYINMGQYQMAIDDYNKAIQLKPDYADAYNNRGTAYMALGRYPLALGDLDKAISLRPDFADVYYNRGNAYINTGNYQRAIDDYNKAIRLKPDFIDAYNNRSAAYIMLGQYQLALEDSTRAIRLKPDYAEVYFNRGNVYAKMGLNQTAVDDYDKAIRLKPDYADAYGNKAYIYFSSGNIKLGCLNARKACVLKNCKILEAAAGKGYCR